MIYILTTLLKYILQYLATFIFHHLLEIVLARTFIELIV